MKKQTILLAVIITCQLSIVNSFAQSPQGFNYQAVARTSSGVAITNQSIGLQIRLLQGSATGTVVYTETHTSTSNNIGLLNVVVGTGITIDNFNLIDWANGPYFIEISMDVTGGATYVLMGAQQLMSVPYALYAANGGTTGATGATGGIGPQGVIGLTGATGDVGPTGNTGATGFSGSDGDRYATSSTDMLTIGLGMQSLTVQTGLQYSVGQTVLIANSVTDLMKGNCVSYNPLTGALVVNVTIVSGSGTFGSWNVNLDGAPGPVGAAGATGPAGANGTNGSNGATGATGDNGTNGTNGVNGATGATGTNGTNGTNGVNGATGATGANGTNGVNGATGATGATGTNGINGTNGTNGATGATGAAGVYAAQFNFVNNGFTSWLVGNVSDYVSGNNSNPTLNLYKGHTYYFNVTVSGHPLRISSTNVFPGTPFNTGVTNQDAQNSVLVFKVPQDAPATLYYNCIYHSGMLGVISIH